jgi:signal transduction histidine kinase
LALFCWQHALSQTNEVPEVAIDSISVRYADSLYNSVITKYYKKEYDKVISLGVSYSEVLRKKGIDSLPILIMGFVGNSFLRSGDTLTSKQIFEENLLMANKLGRSNLILTARIDLANVYALQSQYDKANILYEETIPFAEQSKDTSSLFVLNSNITEINLREKKVKDAREHLEATKLYANSSKVPMFIAYSNMLEGWLLFMEGKYKNASAVFSTTIEPLEDLQFVEALVELYHKYSLSEAALGNYEKALTLLQKHNEYQETKYEGDKIAAIEAATAKFQVDRYRQELREQELQSEIDQEKIARETTLFWVRIAAGIVFVASIFVFISYIRRKKLLKSLIATNKQYLIEKDRAEELSRAKSVLFSNVTHELRTPMFGIIGISSMLLSERLGKKQREHVSYLKFSAEYLLSLINNVLHFNKSGANTTETLESSELNLRETVHHCIEASKYLDTTFSNTYTYHQDANVPNVLLGDRAKLSQLLINLLGNATKFTQDGTINVRVSLQKKENTKLWLTFEIKDTGKGIPPDKLKHVLEGMDMKAYSTSSFTGTGLGLPIVKRIVDQWSGQITINSKEGEGTQVLITLPFEEVPCQMITEKTASPIEKTKLLDGLTILVVDDNKINRLVTQKKLEGFGAKVSLASCGEEGIDTASQDALDLVFMDINMPGMDGFEAAKRIRELRPNLPIIALTAVEEEKVLQRENFSIMSDIIIKPFNDSDFIEMILKHVAIPK